MAWPAGLGAASSSGPGSPTTTVFPWRSLATVAAPFFLFLGAWLWLGEGRRLGGALLVGTVLLVLTGPALLRAARTETSFDLAGLMALGLVLRFVGAYFRWTNAVDANVYQQNGAELAESFRRLVFDVDTGAPVPGTGAMRFITGLVHVPTSSDEFATFLVFAWLGFWGCVFFYRAVVTALPDVERYRYARLIFLWPSLVFWPSSIGKESWMLFTIGLAMLGASRVLVRARGGYSLLLLGLFLASLVRPHVALLALVAFGVAFAVGRRESQRSRAITPAGIARVFGLVLILVVGSTLASRTEDLLDTGDGRGSSLESSLETLRERTAEGESTFTPADPQTPDGYVTATVTVLFRPFPQEVGGFEQVATAFEALFLLGLFAMSWRRLRTLPGRLFRQPYVLLALAFLLMFVYAFSAIGNFGILARQRTQVLPFVFVLLSVPAAAQVARIRPARPTPSAR